MNKKQKIIIIVVAIIDIAVIGFLARTIFNTWSAYPVSILQPLQSNCSTHYLKLLRNNNQHTTISLHDKTIYLTVTQINNENIEDAVLLWSILDQLKQDISHAKKNCPYAETIIIQQKISQNNIIRNHISIISIDDLYAWSDNSLSEDDFAATIRYHQSTSGSSRPD